MTTTQADRIETARNHFRQAAAILRRAHEDAAAELRAVVAMFEEETAEGIRAFCAETLDRPMTVEEHLCMDAGCELQDFEPGELLSRADVYDTAAAVDQADLDEDYIPLEEAAKRRAEKAAQLAAEDEAARIRKEASARKARAAEVECVLSDLLPALNRKIREAADREIGKLIATAKDGVLSGRIRPAEARL